MKKEDTKTPAEKTEEKKAVAKKEKPAKPAKAPKAKKAPKAPKELKTYPVKKLPKIYKKTYTHNYFIVHDAFQAPTSHH